MSSDTVSVDVNAIWIFDGMLAVAGACISGTWTGVTVLLRQSVPSSTWFLITK